MAREISRTKRIGHPWERPPSERDLCRHLVECPLGAVDCISPLLNILPLLGNALGRVARRPYSPDRFHLYLFIIRDFLHRPELLSMIRENARQSKRSSDSALCNTMTIFFGVPTMSFNMGWSGRLCGTDGHGACAFVNTVGDVHNDGRAQCRGQDFGGL